MWPTWAASLRAPTFDDAHVPGLKRSRPKLSLSPGLLVTRLARYSVTTRPMCKFRHRAFLEGPSGRTRRAGSSSRGEARAAAWTGLVVGLALFLFGGSVHGAPPHEPPGEPRRGGDGPFATADTSWEGTSELVALAIDRLGRDRVRITATLDYEELSAEDGLLVLHPKVDLSFDEVSRFLRGGGRLGLLDDFGRGDTLLQRFGIRRVPPPSRPLYALRGSSSLAIATPAVEMVAGVERGRHPIVSGVEQVITNHPQGLLHPQLTPVLEIPAADGLPVPFAVTGIIANRGRMLAVGDPSIFINLMMRYPGNRSLAEGVVDYLVADDEDTPRGGKLFILANDFRQTGRFGGGSHWEDDLEEHLRDIEEEVGKWRERGLPDGVAWALAWLVAAACGAWLLGHAVRGYRASVPRFARQPALAALGGVAGRASVLAAPSTSAVLPLLELKLALQEALGRRLHAVGPIALDKLPQQCREHGVLSPQDCDVLQRLAARLHQVEQSVVRNSPIKIRERELVQLHEEVLGLVERAERRPLRPPRPGTQP